MKKIYLYLSKNYIKNFLLITFALTFTAAFIDYLQHLKDIDGFNRKVLYLFYRFEEYLSYVYPLTLVFGAVATFYTLLLKNYLVVFESLSYKKRDILKPFIFISLLIYIIFIALNFTSFAYANSSAETLKGSKGYFKELNNIFFKYNDSFVYAKKLDIVNKKFQDATLYKIKDNKVYKIMHFKEANFKNNYWLAKDIEIKTLIYKNAKPTGYKKSKIDSLKILKNYYPKVIKLLYEGKRMSISDGIKAYKLSIEQNIDSSKILSALIAKIFMPLFAPLLIIIVFFKTPISKRSFNKGKYLFYTVGSTLLIWTILYSLNMLSLSGTINPWLGQPLIILALLIGAAYSYYRNFNR